MKKIHTRIKRIKGLSTHLRHYRYLHPGIKKPNRPKTFKTEETAKKWASDHGLKLNEYSLNKVKKNKKFQVVIENGKNKNIVSKKSDR